MDFKKHDLSYFLGPEFQEDNNLMRHFGNMLVLAEECGLADSLQDEFFLLVVGYTEALKLYADVRREFGFDGFHVPDKDVRRKAAEEFRRRCQLIHVVEDQAAAFVRYCANWIADEPF